MQSKEDVIYRTNSFCIILFIAFIIKQVNFVSMKKLTTKLEINFMELYVSDKSNIHVLDWYQILSSYLNEHLAHELYLHIPMHL